MGVFLTSIFVVWLGWLPGTATLVAGGGWSVLSQFVLPVANADGHVLHLDLHAVGVEDRARGTESRHEGGEFVGCNLGFLQEQKVQAEVLEQPEQLGEFGVGAGDREREQGAFAVEAGDE